jgi:O-antigen/teichoic acid export membrane protein
MQAGRKTLARSFFWLGSASLFARVVDLGAIALVLGFVGAEEVGAASVVWTVITLSEPFAGLGANWALLMSPRTGRRLTNDALWLSIVGGVLVTALVVLCSPVLASFLGGIQFATLIAAGAAKLLPASVATVAQQRLARALRHREIAAASAAATLLSALTRVVFAVCGAGAWSFVLANVAYSSALLASFWFVAPFALRRPPTLRRMHALCVEGMPSTLSYALLQWARNIDYVFVAALLGVGPLGIYRVAFDLAMEPLVAIGDVVAKSATPTLRLLARSGERLSATFAYSVRLTLLSVAPLAVITFLFAPTLLEYAKDASFVTAAPVARVLIIAALLRVILGLYTPLAQALGRPGLALRTSAELLVALAIALPVCLLTLGQTFSLASAGVAWCLALLPTLFVADTRFRRLIAEAPRAAVPSEA